MRRQFRNARPQPPTSRYPDLTGHYKVKLKSGRDLGAAIRAFEANPHVDHVEKIGIHALYITPNDPYFEGSPAPSFPYDQFHYWDSYGIDAHLAWDAETGDPTVVVGILDTGVRYFHRDLGGDNEPWDPNNPQSNGNIWVNPGEIPGNNIDDDYNGYVDDTVGWDFVNAERDPLDPFIRCIDQDCLTPDNDPDDGEGHGTHVAGTVSAITNNSLLVAGIAGGFVGDTGHGVKILPMRIGYRVFYLGILTGVVRMDWAAEAMHYIADQVDSGIKVTAINCSWSSSNSGGLDAAVNNLLARDVMVIHAAGNSNSSSPDFLGSKAGVMNVAATDIYGFGASFTNHGSWVDVAAPGVDVLSTYRNPDDPDPTAHYIAVISGTSMSAPHVSGIAALLESCVPALTGPDKFNLIVDVNNTISYTDSRDLGSGIANAKLALDAAGCTGVSCDIVADFNASPTSGCADLDVVTFTNKSTGTITSWFWDFGDGGTSTEQNPSHTYTVAGTYTVSLTAFSGTCSESVTKTAYITVSDVPIADFSGLPTSGSAPLTVDFTDLSGGNPTSWSWDFGDGGTSTEQNPSHTYNGAGTYTVSLTASSTCGSGMSEKIDYIDVTEETTSVMHVAGIVMSTKKAGPNTNAIATVTVVDADGAPVEGATVSGHWSGLTTDSDSGVTKVNGSVSLKSDRVRNVGGTFTFTVDNISKDRWTYDSSANVEMSDSITVP
ncbi:MAG: PKD domain-containing protein [Planctomycetota bacterium]